MSQLLSVAIVLLVLALQFFLPHLPLDSFFVPHYSQPWPDAAPLCATSPASVLLSSRHAEPICRKPSVETSRTFYSITERSMALQEEVKRVAAEFEFSAEDVRKATKEFIREMG